MIWAFLPAFNEEAALEKLLTQLDAHSIDIEEFSVHTPDLDDVFLALTGRTSTKVDAK